MTLIQRWNWAEISWAFPRYQFEISTLNFSIFRFLNLVCSEFFSYCILSFYWSRSNKTSMFLINPKTFDQNYDVQCIEFLEYMKLLNSSFFVCDCCLGVLSESPLSMSNIKIGFTFLIFTIHKVSFFMGFLVRHRFSSFHWLLRNKSSLLSSFFM